VATYAGEPERISVEDLEGVGPDADIPNTLQCRRPAYAYKLRDKVCAPCMRHVWIAQPLRSAAQPTFGKSSMARESRNT
jgi:hypothetical protein